MYTFSTTSSVLEKERQTVCRQLQFYEMQLIAVLLDELDNIASVYVYGRCIVAWMDAHEFVLEILIHVNYNILVSRLEEAFYNARPSGPFEIKPVARENSVVAIDLRIIRRFIFVAKCKLLRECHMESSTMRTDTK